MPPELSTRPALAPALTALALACAAGKQPWREGG
jgi:hypothetical protein